MRIKNLRLKNFFACKEEISIGFSPTGLTELISSDVDYKVDISLDEFLKGIGKFLLKKVSKVDFRPYDPIEPIEMSITLCSEDYDIGYSVIFTLDEFISESLVVDQKLAVYVDQYETSIGAGFKGTGEDEEILLNLYEVYKSTKFITSFISNLSYDYPNISYGIGKFFEKDLIIADSGEGLKWGIDPFIEKLMKYPESVQEKVRNIIPDLGFGINKITEDWRIITDHDPTGLLSIIDHGSGFRILMYMLPIIFSIIEDPEEKCLFITSMSGLHPTLKRVLIEKIRGELGNKNSQILYRL